MFINHIFVRPYGTSMVGPTHAGLCECVCLIFVLLVDSNIITVLHFKPQVVRQPSHFYHLLQSLSIHTVHQW